MSIPAKLYIAFDPVYCHPLPHGHRFPMEKYNLIPAQLLQQGAIGSGHLFAPAVCRDETVLLTHDLAYLNKLKDQTLSASEQRHIGFTQSPALTHRELVITQGTIDCCLHALSHGVSFNVAGGTHHAFADHGEGFCLLNDFAVAANYLLSLGLATKILIIDLDVHQGNGTAHIFRNEKKVFTFSMHGKNNFPFRKETSDLDIGLEDGTTDETYLDVLFSTLPELLRQQNPDFAFFLSGVDILDTDRLGKLKISPEGCKARDRFVFSSLHRNKIPVVTAMGGGYSENIQVIVDAHCQTFYQALEIFELE